MLAINTVIVEDMPVAEEHLRKLLQDHCPQINVIASFQSGKEALIMLPKLNYDLLFLDIEYNDGYNAFNLLKDLEFTETHIIFTTAYDTFRKQASEANTIKYLLKPIRKEELIQAVERSMLIMIGKEKIKEIEQTHEALKTGKIMINSEGITLFIKPDEIICLEADGAYSHIYHLSGDEMVKTLSSQNLGKFEKILNSKRFLRVHKSYLVNTEFVASCRRTKLRLAAGKHNIDVPIARDRRKDILESIAMNNLDL
jgi:two-component system LytT family response regulator